MSHNTISIWAISVSALLLAGCLASDARAGGAEGNVGAVGPPVNCDPNKCETCAGTRGTLPGEKGGPTPGCPNCGPLGVCISCAKIPGCVTPGKEKQKEEERERGEIAAGVATAKNDVDVYNRPVEPRKVIGMMRGKTQAKILGRHEHGWCKLAGVAGGRNGWVAEDHLTPKRCGQ